MRKWIGRVPVAAGIITALGLAPRSAWACAACYGQSDSAMAQGMNWGIAVLLGVIIVVLGGVASFFFFLARRAASHPVGVGAGDPSHSAESNDAFLPGLLPLTERNQRQDLGPKPFRRRCAAAAGDPLASSRLSDPRNR